MSLEIMGRDENATVRRLASPRKEKKYLDEILTTILNNANENTRAITDVAGMCKSPEGTPEAIVRNLWQKLQAHKHFNKGRITGIVYYGKDNVKRLHRGPDKDDIPCTTAMELEARKGKTFFTFYDQKHTRGTDVKQAFKSHALLTLDKNVDNSSVKQAILRFRDLVSRESGQSFSFVMMDDFRTEIRNTLGKNQKLDIEAKDVAIYLRKQERAAEQKNALTIFNKEMKAIVKQAASHLEHLVTSEIDFSKLTDPQLEAYTAFLTARNEIATLVDTAITTLHKKYGNGINEVGRDVFIRQERVRITQRLKDLIECAKTFAQDAGTTLDPTDAIWTQAQGFYESQANDSVALFKRRYPTNKAVRTPSSASDGQCIAVAQAQAQAQAEAQAQAMAMALTQKDIEVHIEPERAQKMGMVSDHHPVNLDFLQDVDSNTKQVNDYGATKNLVHPDLRTRFRISPHLERTKTLRTHYFLTNTNRDLIVLISAEEADAFMRADDTAKNGFNLFDINDYDAQTQPLTIPAIVNDKAVVDKNWNGIDSVLANNMRAVMLGLNNCPTEDDIQKIKSTGDIRALVDPKRPCDIEQKQLLPHLKGRDREGNLAEIMSITQFGLTHNCDIDFTIESRPATAAPAPGAAAAAPGAAAAAAPGAAAAAAGAAAPNVITIGMSTTDRNAAITIPTSNNTFNAYLAGGRVEEWRGDGTESGQVESVDVPGMLNDVSLTGGRFTQLHTDLETHFKAIKVEWDKLAQEKKKLDALKEEVRRKIEGLQITASNLSQDDKGFSNVAKDSSDPLDTIDVLKQERDNVKKEYQDIIDRTISVLEGQPPRSSPFNPSTTTLTTQKATDLENIGGRLFAIMKTLQGPSVGMDQIIQVQKDLDILADDALILRALAATKYHSGQGIMKSLACGLGLREGNYPTTTYGSPGSRTTGGMCGPLQNSTTALEKLITNIKDAAAEIEPIEKKIKALQRRLDLIERRYKEAEAAVAIAQDILEREEDLNWALDRQGLQLVPMGNYRFISSALLDLIDPTALLQMRTEIPKKHVLHLEGEMPDYNNTIATLTETLTSNAVRMTEEEETSLNSNTAFCNAANHCANQLEERPREIDLP
ncbi:hypothetical protein JYU14_04000, partial [Simkania negevensis]|nr:hypothetical protein [Simkania negevensis]